MKHVQFLFLVFFISATKSFSQDLQVEAVYYDEKNELFKIEQKFLYKESNIICYVSHYSNNSYVVKRIFTKRGADSLMVDEKYFYVYKNKIRENKLFECDGWVVSKRDSNHTVWLTGYRDGVYVGDTLLVDTMPDMVSNFRNKMQNQRVFEILNGNIKVTLDSLVPIKIVRSVYVNKIPVNVKWFDDKGVMEQCISCLKSYNSMSCIYESLEVGKMTPYLKDSILWSPDSSYIKWSFLDLNSLLLQTVYDTICGNTFKTVAQSDKSETIFFNRNNIFQNIFINSLVYGDPEYDFDLMWIERERVLKKYFSNPSSKPWRNVYINDDKGRLIKQEEYCGDELTTKVLYSYK